MEPTKAPFKAIQLSTQDRAAYRLETPHGDFNLMRSTVRPNHLYAFDAECKQVKVGRFRSFTDFGGTVRGVR